MCLVVADVSNVSAVYVFDRLDMVDALRTHIWNSLPPNLRLCVLTYGLFRRLLKTFLFGQ